MSGTTGVGAQSSRTARADVKAHAGKRGVGRHLEGWQPGALAVLLAAVSAALAVPRSVPPVELPDLLIAPRALERVAADDRALAAAAEQGRLDTDVRAVGAAIRAFGLVDAGDDDRALATERRNVARAGERAMAFGETALLELRAYQLRSFLRELHRWEATGVESDELRELGGRFVHTAQENGWVVGRRLMMDDVVRGALFKKRWNDLVLVHGAAFEPTREESLALTRFLLMHPPRDAARAASGMVGRAAEERAQFLMEQYRLRKIEELRALDASYPADLARGVIYYRLHRYAMAVEAFRRHLEAHPDGPHTVRAQNYLRAALGRAAEEP